MPALAVAEQFTGEGGERAGDAGSARVVFLCSDRTLDAAILEPRGAVFKPIPARPAAIRPMPQAPIRFVTGWVRSVRTARRILGELQESSPAGNPVVVSMGGYVAAPVMRAAHRLGLQSLLVNLDRVPGKANRVMARWSRHAVSAVEVDPAHCPASLRNLEVTGMPIRRDAVSTEPPAVCRQQFGLEPERPTLLVTGASQGAGSLNDLLVLMCRTSWSAEVLKKWQVLHLCGPSRTGALEAAYRTAGIQARVIEFCDCMGDAWGTATIALSRAGASSVAEAAANAIPTVFAPYPWHRDEHQRFNAQPLVDFGGGWCLKDHIDAAANLKGIGRCLIDLMTSPEGIHRAGEALRRNPKTDAAGRIAAICGEMAERKGP